MASSAHDLLVFLDFLVQSYKKEEAILMISAVLLKVAYKGILVLCSKVHKIQFYWIFQSHFKGEFESCENVTVGEHCCFVPGSTDQ